MKCLGVKNKMKSLKEKIKKLKNEELYNLLEESFNFLNYSKDHLINSCIILDEFLNEYNKEIYKDTNENIINISYHFNKYDLISFLKDEVCFRWSNQYLIENYKYLKEVE